MFTIASSVFANVDEYFSFDAPCAGDQTVPGLRNVLTSYDQAAPVVLDDGRNNKAIAINKTQKLSGGIYW